MKVTIEAYTPNPCEVISKAAGICYGKTDFSMKRIERCFRNGHMSVFEHAYITFKFVGISRACANQLVRHRMAVHNQKSQRYVKEYPDVVVPDTVQKDGVAEYAFLDAVEKCREAYEIMLGCGVPAEDARYILPGGSETAIFTTMNYHELFHFLDLRTDSHAQWEIRDMAWKMVEECRENEEIAPLIALWDGKCDRMSSSD